MRYYKQFPLTTNPVEALYDDHNLGSTGPWCGSDEHSWLCTRAPHGDDTLHEAMDETGWVCARWGIDAAE